MMTTKEQYHRYYSANFASPDIDPGETEKCMHCRGSGLVVLGDGICDPHTVDSCMYCYGWGFVHLNEREHTDERDETLLDREY